MKNLKNKILFIFALLLVIPLSLPLVGCSSNNSPPVPAESVKFVSDKYDKVKGYAIFEVELQKETSLTYEILPSSATTKPVFSVFEFSSDSNRARFQLIGNKVTVLYDNFEEIIVKIQCDTFEDYCIVRLKDNQE